MALTLDPALSGVLRGGLALLFATAAWHKLADFAAFRAALGGYRLVPERALGVAGAGLVALELATACALAFTPRAGFAAVTLLVLYSVAIGVNLARGRREIDCGCFGPAVRQPLSRALVVRNFGLIVLGLAATLPVASRALVLLDGFTIAAGVALGSFVHAAVNGLLANAPRLRALRGV